jgi:hypothetical protein
MTKLYASPFYRHGEPKITVDLDLHETHVRGNNMRLVFATTLTVDVSANDDELRRAFIELVVQSARQVYGPAAMLATSRPALTISETSRDGMKMIDVFEPTVDERISRD